jgi:hypothetical protein
MEILVAIGVVAETAILAGLLAMGGMKLILFTLAVGFGAAWLNRLISLDDAQGRARDEPSGAFMVTLALAPPAILIVWLFARYGLWH